MIVWLTGSTSSGKTWLGDFLQVYHNWIHIDGDRRICLKYGGDDVTTNNLFKSFYDYWFQHKEAPLEMWLPFYKELCEKIAEQYKSTPDANIVLSFSTYPRAVRDYVRGEVKKLIGKDLVVILLEMSKADYVKRQRAKLAEWMIATNKTAAEIWEEHEAFRSFGEYSEENIDKYYGRAKEMKGLEPIQVDEENSFTIDTNNGHVKVVPEITRILKLSDTKNFDNEAIMKIRSDRLAAYQKEKAELNK